MENTIIYLIGFAGVGKFTIAQQLHLKTGAQIVDNHLINNPILSVIYTDGITPIPKAAWHKIAIIRQTVYSAIEDISPKNWNFIFTNELIDGYKVDAEIFASIAHIAQKRNSIFIPVRLICDLDELSRRVQSTDRASRYKLTSVEATHHKFESFSVLKCDHPNTLTLDVTHLTATESADKIIEHIKAIR